MTQVITRKSPSPLGIQEIKTRLHVTYCILIVTFPRLVAVKPSIILIHIKFSHSQIASQRIHQQQRYTIFSHIYLQLNQIKTHDMKYEIRSVTRILRKEQLKIRFPRFFTDLSQFFPISTQQFPDCTIKDTQLEKQLKFNSGGGTFC